MIEAKWNALNDNEILLYLGYKGQEIDDALKQQIEICKEKAEDAILPRLVYRRMPLTFVNGQPAVSKAGQGEEAGFLLPGNDLRMLLAECDEVVLLAATIGPKIEKLLMKRGVQDMADAMIMDACASCLVENVCDHFEIELRTELEAEGLFLTDRFSPGYGDFPITMQSSLAELLNCSRRIGLTVSSSNLLVPRKSVTAVLGISRREQTLRMRGCNTCGMVKDCPYHKNGGSCRARKIEE